MENKQENNWLKEFEYTLPFQGEKQIKKYNEVGNGTSGFTPLKTTDEHVEILVDKIVEALFDVSDSGGSYSGDHLKITFKVEYCPEDK